MSTLDDMIDNDSSEAVSNPEDEAQQLFPNAKNDEYASFPLTGLEFADIRRLLAEKFDGVDLQKDDPTLWVFTILDAIVQNYSEQLMEREKHLFSAFNSKLNESVNAFTEAIRPASELALNTQFSAMLEQVSEQAKVNEQLRSSLKRTAMWVSISGVIVAFATLVNVILFFTN